MKLVIYDKTFTGQEGHELIDDVMRVDAILHGFGQLDFMEVAYFSQFEDAAAFADNATVSARLAQDGDDVLPITMVDDEIVKTGSYPTNEEFTQFTGIRFSLVPEEAHHACGCGHHHHHHEHGESCGSCGHHHHHHEHDESCDCGHHHHHHEHDESCDCGHHHHHDHHETCACDHHAHDHTVEEHA